jgi:hypothetical protein
MQLIHIELAEKRSQFTASNALRIECASGNKMWSIMQQVICMCDQHSSNESTVVWSSYNDAILLWLEDKKYESYFFLRLNEEA